MIPPRLQGSSTQDVELLSRRRLLRGAIFSAAGLPLLGTTRIWPDRLTETGGLVATFDFVIKVG